MTSSATVVRSLTTLTLAGAKIASDAAEAKAKELGIAINIAVAGQSLAAAMLTTAPRSATFLFGRLLTCGVIAPLVCGADHTTYLLYFVRMDNAKITSMEIAIDKVRPPPTSPALPRLPPPPQQPLPRLTASPLSPPVRPTRLPATATRLPTTRTSARRAGRPLGCRSPTAGASASYPVGCPSSTQTAPALEPSEPAEAAQRRSD